MVTFPSCVICNPPPLAVTSCVAVREVTPSRYVMCTTPQLWRHAGRCACDGAQSSHLQTCTPKRKTLSRQKPIWQPCTGRSLTRKSYSWPHATFLLSASSVPATCLTSLPANSVPATCLTSFPANSVPATYLTSLPANSVTLNDTDLAQSYFWPSSLHWKERQPVVCLGEAPAQRRVKWYT